MMDIREYVRPQSLQEAWTLNQKRTGRILGGMGWLKMTNGTVGTAIDLCDLGLDTIAETEEEFVLGAMVSLRALETHPGLERYFEGAFAESVRHIVGVQFRNCATLGGSIWLRAGFSDPLTLLLALDCTVDLYDGSGIVTEPLEEFAARPYTRQPDNRILTAVHVAKNGRRVAYESVRQTRTDFPVLTAAVSCRQGSWRAAVGARPQRAAAVEASSPAALAEQAAQLTYKKNLRGSAEYRRHLAGVLIGRAAGRLQKEDNA